jgi:hypothetical protein
MYVPRYIPIKYSIHKVRSALVTQQIAWRVLNRNYFLLFDKSTIAYYNASVAVVNAAIIGLSPQAILSFAPRGKL